MHTHHKNIRHKVTATGTAALLTLLIASCGDDGGSAGGNADSAYCKTVRNWAVRDLTPIDESDPAAFKPYWGEYLVHVDAARGQAPAEVRDEWVVNSDALKGIATPLFDKYGYSFERIMTEGTDAEKALIDEQPAAVEEAQAAIHEYESRVCGSESYVFSDATFEAGSASEVYCETAVALQEASAEWVTSGFAPDAVRAFVEDSSYVTLINDQTSKAPPEIAGDVKADNAWYLKQWRDVLKKFDYDVRRLLLEGTANDRAAFQQSDPAIRKQHARVAAYEEQVCSL